MNEDDVFRLPPAAIEAVERARRFVAQVPAAISGESWYRIEAKAGRVAAVDLYADIGAFGVPAADFRRAINALDVDTIDLHLNSRGGDVFDGFAIKNTLTQHKATVNVTVDGLAASAASLIAMAGDSVTMAEGAQMMVHDASGLCYGNAADMAQLGAVLDKVSDGMARAYAKRAGGKPDEWRAVMRAETWLSDEEAVAAGLADAVLSGDPDAAIAARAKFDLTVFAHAGREHAPAPRLPSAEANSQTPPAEPAGSTTPTTTLEVTVADEAATTEVEPGSDSESPPTVINIAPAASAAGPDLIAEVRKQSTEIAGLKAQLAARDKVEFFDTVTAQGRLAPADRAEYEALYDVAPDQTKVLLLAKAVGSAVPVAMIGHEGEAETNMSEYEALYGKGN